MRQGRRQNERQVMIRIIKLLFSFADMAERAAYRSILVRTFLLTLFRIAEPVARRYVLRYDGNVLKIPEPLRGDDVSGRVEALHLAWLFRVFAMMLTNLMAWCDLGRIDTPTIDAQVIGPRYTSPARNPRNQHMPARASPAFPVCPCSLAADVLPEWPHNLVSASILLAATAAVDLAVPLGFTRALTDTAGRSHAGQDLRFQNH